MDTRTLARPALPVAGARPAAPGAAMTRRDFAWFRMDQQKNLMVINSVLLFAGPADLARLTATVARRLPNYRRFTQKVRSAWGMSSWVDDDAFDISAHIVLEPLGHVQGRDALQRTVSALAQRPLDPQRPLWQMHVIDQFDGGHAIVFRVHHCITDGLGLMHVLNHLTDDNDERPGGEPSDHGHPHLARVTPSPACSILVSVISWLSVAGHIARLALLLPDARSRLKRALGGAKQLVWLPPLPIARLRAISRRTGVTLNDIWVAAVAGALRDYLAESAEPLDAGALRGAVTFNLREKANAFQLGNEFGLVAVDLPTDIDTPRERLRHASARMNAIKRSRQPKATMAFLSLAGSLPHALQRLALWLFTSKGSVVLTNIEGPSQHRYLAGSKLTELICWVPQAGTIGTGLAFISYAGQVQLALFVDTALIDNPQRLMALTVRAFDEIDYATRHDGEGRRA